MAMYLIETRHMPEQCLQDLDTVLAEAPKFLDQLMWGCGKGVHAGSTFVEADSEEAARRLIPNRLLSRTQVVEVGKFVPEQIRSFHTTA